MLLTQFRATRPPHEVAQQRSLDWLAIAHAEAEAVTKQLDDAERIAFAARIARVLKRCACDPDKIRTRAMAIPDLATRSFAENLIYDLPQFPHGRSWSERSALFANIVDAYFVSEYSGISEPPADLIHVTCTGYVSPSGAQKLVAQKRWGQATRVTHAYQMGCYAAMPAIRIAAGFAATGSNRIDIVHTELCSLHLDPTDHRVEQLVVQSLFADGLIRYSVTPDGAGPGLRPLAMLECVVPDSAGAMSWVVSNWGMQMTLARDVPDRIAGALRGFVTELLRRAGLDLGAIKASVFAVHPGGPKIIDRVAEVLELAPAQVSASRDVLYDHGNMSSATLPHIWMRMLEDPRLPRGTLIPSLAFGPGLTVCGALLEKR
ncbi:MAG: Chalcone synthase [Myxococcales bacterium]|nr:Chalcone synthase [Myxococcales bacterium]